MKPQGGRRSSRTDLGSEALLYARCLSASGGDTQNRSRLQYLADRHRDRLARHVAQGIEPAFADLLLSRLFSEVYNDKRIFRCEIGRRLVEGKMSVFTDASECDVDRRRGYSFRCLCPGVFTGAI